MPLSAISRVRFFLSAVILIFSSGSSPRSSGSVCALKRSLSMASDALEISSRRKIPGGNRESG